MNRPRSLALALCALALGACDDATAPDGSASTATVYVYVDADGSGARSAGDVLVAGVPVTLTPLGGGTAVSVTTNSSGVALFESLDPGSYTVTMSGTVPAGAVLATATSPVIVAPFQGDSLAQEFRFVYNPGSVEGRLYRDNNGNSVFDAGDTPAPGIPVSIFAGSTATGTAIATTTTDANGQFSFRTLRPGTYTYSFTPLPTMTVVGGNASTVTVGANAPTAAPETFTGTLISTITGVRSQPAGSAVSFEGVVTAGVGVFSTSATSNQFNVQDASGAGILVLGVPLSSGIALGDSVSVTGTTFVNAGELVVGASATPPTVTRLATGRSVPAPRLLTAAQVAASNATDPNQGSLVRVRGLRVDSVQSGTAAGFNVFVSNNGVSPFVVRVGTTTAGSRSLFVPGAVYTITGTLSSFNGPQIKIRSPADVATGGSIAEARTRFLNDTATVQGVVTVAPGPLGASTIYLQDETGGIMVFNYPQATTPVVIGDTIRLTGRISAFGGEPQIDRFSTTSPIQVVKLGSGAAPAPRAVTGSQLAGRTQEGFLVRMTSIRVDSVGTGTTSYNVHATSSDGVRLQIRVASITGVGIPIAFWVVGNRYDVTGLLGFFTSTTFPGSQIKPRSAADVTAAAAIQFTDTRATRRNR